MSYDEGPYTPPAGSWLAQLEARVKALEAHRHPNGAFVTGPPTNYQESDDHHA